MNNIPPTLIHGFFHVGCLFAAKEERKLYFQFWKMSNRTCILLVRIILFYYLFIYSVIPISLLQIFSQRVAMCGACEKEQDFRALLA